MKVDKITVGQIFDTTQRLDAPLFQRPYVWRKRRNWEPLFQTIQSLAQHRVRGTPTKPHFLGTVVLVQNAVQTGRVQTREIIDGQQRLITLQLLLAALRDVAERSAIGGYFDEFKKLTRNHTPLSRVEEDAFKVWPTNQDREEFRSILASTGVPAQSEQGGSEDVDEDEPEADDDADDEIGLLSKAYGYFLREVSNWLGTSDPVALEQRCGALHEAIVRDLLLVVIDLEQGDDPQEIFETLNGLGTPLLPADLVKNHLFHLAAKKGLDGEMLHRTYWQEFDTNRRYWRRSVGRGRQKRPRLDIFLSHFLTLRAPDSEITADRLFESYKHYVERSVNEPIDRHMDEFQTYARVYKQFDDFDPASPAGTFFTRLAALEMTTAHPLLLEVIKRTSGGTTQESHAIFRDLESFVVRRAVCRLSARSYNEFFRSLIRECRQADDFGHARIRAFLLQGSSEVARWPANDEFKESWLQLEFYKKLKRATPMILQAIEDAMRGPKSELARVARDVATIEHLMPQKWESHWRPPLLSGDTPEQAARRRKQAIHRIGNLTLLTKSLNPSVSNGPWSDKRDAIRTHGTLLLHNSFLDQATWDERAIESRSLTLFEYAAKTWPRP